MSTFNGVVCEIEGISVDCFEHQNLTSTVFFLSHCHTDHYRGINSEGFLSYIKKNDFNIYTSEVSSVILRNRFPVLKDCIKALDIRETHTIVVPNFNRSGETIINVSLIPAGHCPGSVMFLITSHDNTTILCTGDFRINSNDLQKFKTLGSRTESIEIDKIYLDTTFWDPNYNYFPSRMESCNVVCDIIQEWLAKDQRNKINLMPSASIGIEYLCLDIYERLKTSIHIKDCLLDPLRLIKELENVFTTDFNNARIFMNSKKNCSKNVRNIKVSALRWRNMKTHDEFWTKSEDNFYYVCLSTHCSYEELKAFLKYFRPKFVEPCVINKNSHLNASLEEFCNNFIRTPTKFKQAETYKSINKRLKTDIKTIECKFYSSESEDE